MRPVERGPAPRTYAKYDDAIRDLRTRIGGYCSDCERQLPVNLAVEHIVPKDLHPELETEWTNFLLACTNCNSVKGSQDINIENYLWPHLDNTFLAFIYSCGGFVQLVSNLSEEQRSKAQALLNLVGLQRHQSPGWDNPTSKDKRWQQREEIWATAEKSLELFEKLDRVEEAKEQVLIAAQSYGFFSVWMAVFENHPEVRKGLIQRFIGTAPTCFDPDGKPLNRPGGNI